MNEMEVMLSERRPPGNSRRADERVPRGRLPRWPEWSLGSLMVIIGSLWMLVIIGVRLPWYSVLPMVAIVTGGFFMVRALNQDEACVRSELSHDRCDH
jgi:hypothetical protein